MKGVGQMGLTIADLFRRRATRLMLCLALLAGVVPFGIASADGHEATWTDITFTSTTVETVEEGESWVDEAGIFHIRGNIFNDVIAGDLTGSAVVHFNLDFQPAQECGPDDEVCPGYSSFWGSIEITDENGRWAGDFMQNISDVPDEEFMFSSVVLRGLGGNAGKSIVAEFLGTDEEEGTITVGGRLMTMATPIMGINLSTQLCFQEDFTTTGGFHGTGAIESSGSASGDFAPAGARWTHNYGLWGTTTLTDGNGSVTIVFGGNAVDVGVEHSNAWGHFVIVEGTGDYEGLFGHGRTIATAGAADVCALGGGVFVSYVGEAHYN